MQDTLKEAREYFDTPQMKYQKVLGFGGLGMALHYKYEGNHQTHRPARDFVIKVSVGSWVDEDLRDEALRGSAHCVQLLFPEEVEGPELSQYVRKPRGDDSSDDSVSSGDESITGPTRLARNPRRLMQQAEKQERLRRWHERLNEWINRPHDENRKDYLLLEYLEGGTVQDLIEKMKRFQKKGYPIWVPNRILWQIWLCLVRACVALKYPPRKFHPDRSRGNQFAAGPESLIETIPPPEKRWRAKNIVHFDIDPSNIFIGNLEQRPPELEEILEGFHITSQDEKDDKGGKDKKDKGSKPQSQGASSGPKWRKLKRKYDEVGDDRAPGEHSSVPIFKLADFGLAKNVERQKRNEYYFRRRKIGKADFLAPEQFAAEWDKIPPVRSGPEVSEQDVIGNYGSPMNVWGMALVMWRIITQLETPKPPQPQIPLGSGVSPDALPNNPNITLDDVIESYREYQGGPGSLDDKVDTTNPDVKVSYCPFIMEDGGFFKYIDKDFRTMIYECMYHRPGDRPTVEQLLAQAEEGITRVYEGEDDATIATWVNAIFYSAPTQGNG
ncbi:kinase-like protein [Hypoxylon trugodes]|uniref:kinase-like protein n=1 Tax=Hypoxylon trugodes TaxID=326681 RepID=UPI00218F5485|nr:kinase-like protein [Hypoxylon trugodes]KAI1385713.1 kinase-like protein [Hypoxylon trugodes]